jgi:hypothetical protein
VYYLLMYQVMHTEEGIHIAQQETLFERKFWS